MDNHYKGLIWTNHALDRLRERGIKQGDAWATWNHPEHSRKGTVSGSWIYYRNYGDIQIEVVAKQNEKKEWLILSVWSKTIYPSNSPNLPSSSKISFWRSLYNFIFRP